jgi:hypothetical protein
MLILLQTLAITLLKVAYNAKYMRRDVRMTAYTLLYAFY